MDYEVFEPVDDTPLEVAYSRMFNSGFYRCPKPQYATEVNKDEDKILHPGYLGDFVLPNAG